ncbi:His Kinase A (phospho-acceptor) domain-containing protein [Desulfuromusa kysingii]|uniref:histidine kinase n=2 Tax=Desulfuromusa kysingii TaxID=37625 RepID=A0A1H4AGQ4_9BACT|nr:His Kinase A (phospho-acceptor) domain-containing protein [Desulfuromusa kysingii]
MTTRSKIKRNVPLILILLILLLGFSWHIFNHHETDKQHKAFNDDIHNAEAKMLLGHTVVVDLVQVAQNIGLYRLEGKEQGQFLLIDALAIIDDIDRVLDVLINGGVLIKKIPTNISELEEANMDVSSRPPQIRAYDLDALVLRTQVQDLKEKISTVQETPRLNFSQFGKELSFLIDRIEEDANKLSVDAQTTLLHLHEKREALLVKSSKMALIDALFILSVISGLIVLVFKQIGNVRSQLEYSIVELKTREKELNEKNELISQFNESLEEKVQQRTEQLRAESDERKNIEAQLLETRKFEAIGQLAGGIAHDFNNVLTIILGYGSLVKQKVLSDEKLVQDVNTVITAAKKAEGLTRQLLAFSRKQILKPTAVNLNLFLAESEKLLKRLLRENIVLSVCAAEKPIVVTADSSQLDQVLINLVVNARDAIGENSGEIRFSISQSRLSEELVAQFPQEASKLYGLITIEDSGHGISKEIQDKIFDPFFTTKGQGQGTGLGLSTIYGIVRQSNGYISLQSEVGNGTKFFIFLPLTDKEAVACKVPDKTGLKRVTGKTILVVDDEEGIQNIIAQVLINAGHIVISASNGQMALDQWKQNPQKIDLLLTDIGMPGMTGIELAEQMTDVRQDLPVIFTSGYGEFHSGETAMLNKYKYFLQKPFETISLFNQLDEIFL